MGMLSLGTGWNYYRNHWETDVYLGIVPRNSDRHAMATLTLKQNYYPWNIRIADKLSFEPLACGVYINTLLDRDFGASSRTNIRKAITGSLLASVPMFSLESDSH
ncbi:hypothetical protein NXW71_04915 [Parabacteroides merdae]|nr:hypothetical protein [Parabacteroides merdae]